MNTYKLAIFSSILNHHQVGVADELYRILGENFSFIELNNDNQKKGSTEDFSTRPYLIKAWESQSQATLAMKIARYSEACIFGGVDSLPYEKERLKNDLLTLDMDERPLKRGLVNILSKANIYTLYYYWSNNWKSKPLYKLCCSAFTAKDYERLYMYKDKCFKWGYFTRVNYNLSIEKYIDSSSQPTIPIMWCGRFLKWKHPEMPVQMAAKLKSKGYKFHISIYGDERGAAKYDKIYPTAKLEKLIRNLGVEDCVSLKGNIPNNEIIKAMQKSAIFLFTSNCFEGWGAVANESMANGCVLIASDAVGSAPYLIKDGENGFCFKSECIDSLVQKVEWLFTHPEEMKQMRKKAFESIVYVWSPSNAVCSLLQLIDDLQNSRKSSIKYGPCSKA